jgi:hypothetical protein
MAIPETSREAVLDAISRFERGERSSNWRGGNGDAWRSDSRDRYALRHEGRLYPVKEIVRLAIRSSIGEEFSTFSGGRAANGYARRYGFEVVALEEGAPVP